MVAVKETTDRPILRGTLTAIHETWWPCGKDPSMEHRSASISVWCPHCRCFHTHGWDPADDHAVESHRVAHCHDSQSPFNRGGYYISVFGPDDVGYEDHAVTPGVPIKRKKAASAGQKPTTA